MDASSERPLTACAAGERASHQVAPTHGLVARATRLPPQSLDRMNHPDFNHWAKPARTFPVIGSLLIGLALTSCVSLRPGEAALIRELRPLSVRGVNYFPRETPWGGMWTKTPAEVFEKDMGLAASLGCNTVRTFLQFAPHIEQAGLVKPDGSPTPAYLEKFDQLLAAAWRHGIRVVVCFEFAPQWLSATNAPRWQRALTDVVGAHRDDGRVLMWDVMNEPDDDAKWTEATRAYLKAAMPFVKQLDTNHPTTVGIAYRIDRLASVGLPDVLQYHEYCPKTVLFEKGAARVGQSIAGQRRAGGTRPLVIGEFGMCTARDPRHGADESLKVKMGEAPGTEADQARIYEIVLAGAESAQIAGVMPWCLYDYRLRNPNESHFGLVRTDGTWKPAALVLQKAFARWSRR